MGDVIVIIALMMIVGFAVRSILKKNYSCNGDCSHCNGSCHVDFKAIRKSIKESNQ